MLCISCVEEFPEAERHGMYCHKCYLDMTAGIKWKEESAPAQEEKEMEPIERLAIAAEQYVEKCDENHPLHEAVMSANLKHLCGLMAPADRAADLRQLHRDAFLAAITGLMGLASEVDCGVEGLVHDAVLAADSAIRQYNPDAVIAEVVG